MKKILYPVVLFTTIILSGCFDIFNESTINEDGSGVYINTTDMSSMIGMMKMMGEDLKELESIKLDSTISLKSFKDSIANITGMEKILLEKATLNINFNFSEESMVMTFSFPYSQQSDMISISRILKEIGSKSISKQMESMLPGMGDEEESGMDESNNGIPDLDEYFDFIYENGKISKKLNHAKYSTISENPQLNSLKEMGQMGTPMKITTIFNLPGPVKKAEGIGLKISENKKKITIEATIDDFFDSPEKMEFVIEY